MRASLTLLKAWRPQMIGPTYEVVRYESRLTACRVCPEHQSVLDDELKCSSGHTPGYWEVRYLRSGCLEAKVLHRATGHKPLQDIPPGCLNVERRHRYLVETAWLLRKKYGMSVEESKAEALRRWEERVANTLA